MNDLQKTRANLKNFYLQDRESHGRILRRKYFEVTGWGTKGVSIDRIVTVLAQHGVSAFGLGR